MRKHAAAAFVIILLSAGVLFAQGVAITQPLNGLVSSDANQRVTYVFATPSMVDSATIMLNIDGIDYFVGHPDIAWTPVNFSYDVDPEWTEGVHSCSLWQATDTLFEDIEGIPLITNFTVDLSGPYLDIRSPGVVGEAEPMTTSNVLEPIMIDIKDDWGTINLYTIQVMIDGVVYDHTSPGVFLTEIDDGMQFAFYPDSAGMEWEENDFIEVELLTAEDSPDYGAPNMLFDSPDNMFSFFVDADGPEPYPVDPIPFFRQLTYLGCSDYELQWRIEDENGLDLTTFSIQINSMTYNWGDYRIWVDTLVAAVLDTDSLGTPIAWDVQSAIFHLVPAPHWYEGVVYTIDPPMISDIYGNPATGWEWGAYLWTEWQIMFDNTGPTVSNTYPVTSYVTRNQEEPLGFDVTDTWGSVDPLSIHLIIETSSGDYYEYDGWTSVMYPEITWDGLTFEFDPAVAGITWPQGDTVFVTVWDVMDSMEFCEANHMNHGPVTWTFYVADGPMPEPFAPKNLEFSSCQTQMITFDLCDPDGIDPASVLFEVEGEVFDIDYEIAHYDTHWVGPVMLVDTTIFNPFYQVGPNRFTLDPTMLPAGIVDYRDAAEINCTILAADDALGNPMWGGPYSYRFWIDFSSPYPGMTVPADGGVSGGPYPSFSIDIMDDVCGMIDPYSVTLQIRGVNYNPMIDPGVYWEDIPGGGRISVETEDMIGLSYGHGEVAHVCLTSAYDNAQNRCSLWGNPAIGLPYCWEFTVDNNPPVPTIVEPGIDEITACDLQPIIIEVTDDYGVDPNYFQMVINDVVVTWPDPRLTWDGTYLTYTPTTAYPEGLVTWSLSSIGDGAGNIDATSPIAGATFYADYSTPVIAWTEPADGELAIAVPDFIKLGIDDMAGIDIDNTVITFELYDDIDDTLPDVFVIDEVTFPGVFTFDEALSELWIDLDIAGITFDFNVYNVDVTIDASDNPEYACPDPNMLVGYQFSFMMNPGWEVQLWYYPDGDTIPTEDYNFGAYVGATDEYDDGVDERIPPSPPTETPISFITPGLGEALSDDFHDLDAVDWSWSMFTGTQTGCIQWDPADLPDLGSFVINGTVDMRGEHEYCFGPGELLEINVTREIMMLASGWNIVSVPIEPVDPTIEAVFPMVDPLDIWEYTGAAPAYVHPAVVQPGHAYFILYTPGAGDPDPIYFDVPGAPLMNWTRDLNLGWQTIGSVYDFAGVNFSDPDDEPDGACDPYVYWLNTTTGSYETATEIVAGKGYWNLVSAVGSWTHATLNLEVGYDYGPRMIPEITEDPEWTSTLTFKNETEKSITIGGLDIATVGFDRGLDMPIPPALPGATFDVYVEGTEFGRLSKDIRNNDGWTIVVNAENSVVLEWSGDAPENMVLIGNGQEIEISGEGSAVVDPGIYVAKQRVPIPEDYALVGAAPNPFNAACGINFDLPEEVEVTVEVFDMLGKKVNTLVNNEMKPGSHRVIWNGCDDSGREASSGVYLYRLQAGDFKASGRMVLMR